MNSQHGPGSHLFLVRLWSDEVADQNEWRGRVQHVLSGEARTFDDWAMLVEQLLEMANTDGAEANVPGGKSKEAIQ